MQLQCSVLKHQIVMNLFMILKIVTIFKSSREYTVKMASQSTRASTYEKLLKTEVQVGSKEICNIPSGNASQIPACHRHVFSM